MKSAPSSLLELPEAGFLVDPKALRPAKLRKTVALVASETEAAVCEEERYMGRPMYRRLFCTLTYAENTRGKAGDVSRFLDCLQAWARRSGVRVPYEWVGELQERGALHYHLLIWLPKHLLLPMFDWRGWWRHGSTKIERAKNPVAYLAKYASKFKDSVKRFRKGTRLYGWGGLSPVARENVRRARMTRWMRRRVDEQLETEWQVGIEFEIAQQEREELAFLQWAFPDEYARHPPLQAWIDEREEHEEADQRMVEEWDRQSIVARLRRRGWARFARCVGGFVDKLTGEFSATPWAAQFRGGTLWVWPKEAV